MSYDITALISLLKGMCENNDHVTTLCVLQTLGKVKRAGYIDIDGIVLCLSYCSDIFATHGNMEFFREFASCMSDITEASPDNPFSLKSRCYYYFAKNEKNIIARVQKYCPSVDVDVINEHMLLMISRNNIFQNIQLDRFYKSILRDGEDMNYRDFVTLCSNYSLTAV